MISKICGIKFTEKKHSPKKKRILLSGRRIVSRSDRSSNKRKLQQQQENNSTKNTGNNYNNASYNPASFVPPHHHQGGHPYQYQEHHHQPQQSPYNRDVFNPSTPEVVEKENEGPSVIFAVENVRLVRAQPTTGQKNMDPHRRFLLRPFRSWMMQKCYIGRTGLDEGFFLNGGNNGDSKNKNGGNLRV